MTHPRRRWSYSLRTLLVVVTVAAISFGWVVYQLNWIMQRHQFLRERGPYLIIGPVFHDCHGQYPDRGAVAAPGGLWLFGDEGVARLIAIEPSDLETARRLFPEAKAEIVRPKELDASSIEPVK